MSQDPFARNYQKKKPNFYSRRNKQRTRIWSRAV